VRKGGRLITPPDLLILIAHHTRNVLEAALNWRSLSVVVGHSNNNVYIISAFSHPQVGADFSDFHPTMFQKETVFIDYLKLKQSN